MRETSQIRLGDEIPGYREAVMRERFARDAAFIHSPVAPLNESIAGFTVAPLTLRHLLTLRISRSPLFGIAIPSPGQISAFLWLLSPHYRPRGFRCWWFYSVQCRRFLPEKLP